MIKILRKQRGLLLKKVADELGISESFLSQIENGNRRPSQDLIAALAKYYGTESDLVCISVGLIPPWLLARLRESPVELIAAANDHFRKYGK